MLAQNQTDVTEYVTALLGRVSKEERDKFLAGLSPTMLMLCQLLPLVLAWLSCFFKVLFGRKDWPTFKALVVVSVVCCL